MGAVRFVSGLVAGSMAGAAVGLFVIPRRKKGSLMRGSRKLWSKVF